MFLFKELNLCAGVTFSIFLVIIIGLASGDYYARANPLTNELCVGAHCSAAQYDNGFSGSMWFGPRLGRRRRSEEVMKNEDQTIDDIANAINVGPWTLVAYHGSGDKRHSTQFTPRLGRELGENFIQKLFEFDQDDESPLMDSSAVIDGEGHRQKLQAPPPAQFAPRLGRHSSLILSSPSSSSSPSRLGHRFRVLKNFQI